MLLSTDVYEVSPQQDMHVAWTVILGLIVALVSSEVTILKAAERPPAKVMVEKVRITEVAQTFPAIGRFISRQHGVVSALASGPVRETLVEVGERVERGQVVARIVIDRIRANRDLLLAELQEREAGLKTAKAQLKFTMGELARLDGLRRSAAFSQARYSDKQNEVAKFRSEVTEAQSAVAKARANLELAKIDLRNAEVRAPFDAVVVQKHAVTGAYLAVGDPVVTLVNDRQMEIEVNVPAERLEGVLPGRMIEARLDNGTKLRAEVRAIVPLENAKTRTRPVRFRLTHVYRRVVADNQSVTVMLPVARAKRVLTVHKDAVTSRDKRRVVILVDDSTARPRNVQLGAAIGDRFAVVSGLKDGDIVVVRGNEGLRSGQKLAFEKPGD